MESEGGEAGGMGERREERVADTQSEERKGEES